MMVVTTKSEAGVMGAAAVAVVKTAGLSPRALSRRAAVVEGLNEIGAGESDMADLARVEAVIAECRTDMALRMESLRVAHSRLQEACGAENVASAASAVVYAGRQVAVTAQWLSALERCKGWMSGDLVGIGGVHRHAWLRRYYRQIPARCDFDEYDY
jgi:hypothetical protein